MFKNELVDRIGKYCCKMISLSIRTVLHDVCPEVLQPSVNSNFAQEEFNANIFHKNGE